MSFSSLQTSFSFSTKTFSPTISVATPTTPTTFIIEPVVFNCMLVFAIEQTFNVSSCTLNSSTEVVNTLDETISIDGINRNVRWCYINKKSTIFTINDNWILTIIFNNSTFFTGSLTDSIKNATVCYDETSFNNTSKIWTNRLNTSITTTLNTNSTLQAMNTSFNSDSALNNIKLVGSNSIIDLSNSTIYTNSTNGIDGKWALFFVGRSGNPLGHLLTTGTTTLGAWQVYTNSLYWKGNWITNTAYFNAYPNPETYNNYNVYSYYVESTTKINFVVNRGNSNLATTSIGSTNYNLGTSIIGHDVQSISSGQNNHDAYLNFIIFYNKTVSNSQSRCIEFCLWTQYQIKTKM